MKNLISIYICLVMLTASCQSSSKEKTEDATSQSVAKTTDISSINELPLPTVPMSMTNPSDRAAYIVSHFWDAMDFSDTLRSYDDAFMEQNFANYINLFGYVDSITAQSSVKSLMDMASADIKAYDKLADIADKYLYDPNSPMLNEEAYILFLNTITESEVMDRDRRIRFESHLKDALKNRVGHKATDFSYVDNKGRKGSLYAPATDTKYRLLMFYDPDCDVCEQAKSILSKSTIINDAINDGRMEIIAVYTDGDKEIWNKSKDLLPDNWTSVCSPGGAVDRDEVYIIRATPTLYLLTGDNTVIMKDARATEIIEIIGSLN
ncbi:MAG: DUF5106 domain-containing protein [Muribaculum sp.]|nr:DUF5106 domain-containing protein [Muribaculum sp.]